MGILSVMANNFYQKSDFINNISLALGVSLWIEPFQIQNIGLLLSYIGVISIIFGKKEELEKGRKKLQTKVKKGIIFSCKIYTIMLPIIISLSHSISFTFWLSNIVVAPFLTIVLIGGMLFVIENLCFSALVPITVLFLNKVIEWMLLSIHLCANLPFSNQYMITLPIPIVIVYEILIIGYYGRGYILRSKRWCNWERRYRKKLVMLLLVFIIIEIVIVKLPQDMKINFIDVGQGDCTLIQTPFHKNILIDGGGKTEGNSYDIGEEIVLPYLSNHQIRKLDLVIISHFDSDHCRWNFLYN